MIDEFDGRTDQHFHSSMNTWYIIMMDEIDELDAWMVDDCCCHRKLSCLGCCFFPFGCIEKAWFDWLSYLGFIKVSLHPPLSIQPFFFPHPSIPYTSSYPFTDSHPLCMSIVHLRQDALFMLDRLIDDDDALALKRPFLSWMMTMVLHLLLSSLLHQPSRQKAKKHNFLQCFLSLSDDFFPSTWQPSLLALMNHDAHDNNEDVWIVMRLMDVCREMDGRV